MRTAVLLYIISWL